MQTECCEVGQGCIIIDCKQLAMSIMFMLVHTCKLVMTFTKLAAWLLGRIKVT